jgi:hypothetical protein
MTDGEPQGLDPKPENLDELLIDSAALMQRWKKAASEITADSIGIGNDIVPHVYNAAKAFQGLNDTLGSYGHLNGNREHIFF